MKILPRFAAVFALMCGISTASADPIVNFNTTEWQNLGTSTITSVPGNFLPGWTTLQATPDLGVNVFGGANQSLSGAADDAALWFNQFDQSNGSNEIARLSLSGFSIGQQYSLDFFATILTITNFGWTGTQDFLEIGIAGANIFSAQSTLLTDATANDGANSWISQSILFTAASGTVSFTFGENAIAGDTNISRLGVDGFSITDRSVSVPEPGTLALLGLGLVGMAAVRRKKKV